MLSASLSLVKEKEPDECLIGLVDPFSDYKTRLLVLPIFSEAGS